MLGIVLFFFSRRSKHRKLKTFLILSNLKQCFGSYSQWCQLYYIPGAKVIQYSVTKPELHAHLLRRSITQPEPRSCVLQ